MHFVDHEVPGQGWKVHLSASGAKDYRNLIAVVCPELIQNNVAFKCLLPYSIAEAQYSEEGAFPDFVKERTLDDVLYFYENVRSRYAETGDLREYLSSMTIGTQCTIKKDMVVITGDKEDVRCMIADFYFEEYPGTASYMDEENGVIFADKGESAIDICRDSFRGNRLGYQLFPAQFL